MVWSRIRNSAVVLLIAMAGCTSSSKPFIAFSQPARQPVVEPTTEPVATSALGTVNSLPGLAPKPKPFIAIPRQVQAAAAKPSTLLLEHASPDSPVPLSEYGNQPAYDVSAFNLRQAPSASDVQRIMGLPAQIADCGDPWLVYRLNGDRELWLHFSGPTHAHLDAADVIAGAEDGYTRDRVFSADDSQ
jgi:hypothetical protein